MYDFSKGAGFNEGILVYPFLWSEESDVESASKSIVPFEELVDLNVEHRRKFGLDGQNSRSKHFAWQKTTLKYHNKYEKTQQ